MATAEYASWIAFDANTARGWRALFITGESARERIPEAQAVGHPIAFKPTKQAKLRALIEHLLDPS